MRAEFQYALWALLLGLLIQAAALAAPRREREPVFATIAVHTPQAGCTVKLDDAPAQPAGPKGDLVLTSVEPGGHYVHVSCPGEDEVDYFISPQAGQNLKVPEEKPVASTAPQDAGLEAAEAHLRLRHLVQQAAQMRAQGQFEDAVTALREAMQLDPKNSDLHRELGITFLIGRDWKSARVEMLEAIHHDTQDSDAYNGLGYALEKLDDLKGAADAYRTAMRLDPGDSSYRSHYFDILAKIQAQNLRKK